jgi:hypothetical protein
VKTIEPAAMTAIEAGEAIVTGAAKITPRDGGDPILVWGGYGPIDIDGDTYQGLGDRALAQQSAGAVGGVAQGLTLSLSGIEPHALAFLDADEVKAASVVLYRLIFGPDGKTLLDAHVFDRGRVDAVDTDEVIGGEAAINVAVESTARGLGRSGARMRADPDQRLINAADGYFKHTAYAGEKMLYWGGKKPSRTSDAVGGSASLTPTNFAGSSNTSA